MQKQTQTDDFNNAIKWYICIWRWKCPIEAEGVVSIFIFRRTKLRFVHYRTSSYVLQQCWCSATFSHFPKQGSAHRREFFNMSRADLILHRCHVISLLSPVDGFRVWAVCFHVTALGSRAVLQQWKRKPKHQMITPKLFWFSFLYM